MMPAEGAVYPVHQLMEDQGIAFDEGNYIPAVISYYSDTNGNLFAIVISQTGTIIGGTPDEVVWLGQFNPSSGALIGGSVVDNTDPACLCAGTWQPN